MKKIIIALLILAPLAAFFFFSSSSFLNTQKSFPHLEEAYYVGTFTHLFEGDTDEGSRIPFTLLRTDNADEFFVTVFDDRIGSSLVSLKSVGEGPARSPLRITSGDIILEFAGERGIDGSLTGEVRELRSGVVGTWSIERYEMHEKLYTQEQEAYLVQWEKLFRKRERVLSELRQARIDVPNMKQEIEQLSELLNDKSALRAKGDKKIQEAQDRYDIAIQKREEKRKELQEVQKRYELATRVAPIGALVALERDITSLEDSWLSQKLELKRMGASEDFQKEVERAREILKIQKMIAIEKQRLSL